jgi:hypothetical protein
MDELEKCPTCKGEECFMTVFHFFIECSRFARFRFAIVRTLPKHVQRMVSISLISFTLSKLPGDGWADRWIAMVVCAYHVMLMAEKYPEEYPDTSSMMRSWNLQMRYVVVAQRKWLNEISWWYRRRGMTDEKTRKHLQKVRARVFRLSEGTPGTGIRFSEGLGPQDWDENVFEQIDALVAVGDPLLSGEEAEGVG